MSTMIERVVKAILKAQFYDCEPNMYESLDEFYRTIDDEHIEAASYMARATIEAMKTAMENDIDWDGDAVRTYVAGIDAALNEETRK